MILHTDELNKKYGIKGGDTTAEKIPEAAEEKSGTTWGPLRDSDSADIGIGRAQKMWVSSNKVSTMDVNAHAKGTNDIEEDQTVSRGNTAEFVAPSGEYWTQVIIKGLGTEDQSAFGDVKWC